MENQLEYNTHLDIKFDHFERIDIPQMVADNKHQWFNQTVTQVNESVVRLGIVEGEYHWHKHDNDDEFFFVLEGQLLIDLEDRTIELKPESRRDDFQRSHAPPQSTKENSNVDG